MDVNNLLDVKNRRSRAGVSCAVMSGSLPRANSRMVADSEPVAETEYEARRRAG